MGLFHVAYNGYVWKALFSHRHPDRSGGIFLAGRDNVVCVIAEKGKPFAKGARKSGVQGRFLDCARNDGMVYIALCEIAEKGKPFAKGARNDGVQGRFLATLEMTVWCIASYVRQRKRGKLLRKEQERAECKEDFLTVLEMTVGKAADSMDLRF